MTDPVAAFETLDLRVGRVLRVEPNEKARKPAYRLWIDFGPLGEKRSSAQLVDLYRPEELVGRLVVAAVNLGKINADRNEREKRLKRWETQLHPVRGAGASDLFAEAERHAKDWDYVQWTEAFHGRPVLLAEADDQNHADMEALAAALRQKSAVALTHVAVQTDHAFSDHRIALQTILIELLEKLKRSRPTGRH